MKLNVKAFALTIGLFWGISVFLLTWWIILIHGASGARTLLGLFYLGYNVSPLGSVIGLIWGFVDGLITSAIVAAVYNWLTDCFSK